MKFTGTQFSIDELWEHFIPEHNDIWLFGMGWTAKEYYKHLKAGGVMPAGFVVTSPESNKAETGEPILSIEQFMELCRESETQGLILTVRECYFDELLPKLAFMGSDLAIMSKAEMRLWPLLKTGLSDVKEIWESNLYTEAGWWDDHLKIETEDGTNSPGVAFKDRNVDINIKKLLSPELDEYDLLDVGSGPYAGFGNKIEGKTVRLICCDPLADQYLAIRKKYNIEERFHFVKQEAEKLLESFRFQQFDCVMARNCLDHAYSPEQCILQMAAVSKRFVYLLHFRNEAETAGFWGLHNWNFDVESSDFVIKGLGGQINFSKKYSHLFNFNIRVFDQSYKTGVRNWLEVVLEKK